MRADADFNERIARLAGTGPARALTLEAQHLRVGNAGGDVEVERAATGKRHALGRASNGLEEVDLERIADVLAFGGEIGARTGSLAVAAEHLGEDVAKTEVVVEPGACPGAGAAARVLSKAPVSYTHLRAH